MNNNLTNQISQKINMELVKICGFKNAGNFMTRVGPGILADFEKMIAKANLGETVKESYAFEDSTAEVTLKALRKDGKNYVDMITEVWVNGKQL